MSTCEPIRQVQKHPSAKRIRILLVSAVLTWMCLCRVFLPVGRTSDRPEWTMINLSPTHLVICIGNDEVPVLQSARLSYYDNDDV